ncbi:PilZ domain-containing protein [Rhodoferax sp.]|uniref:PilZ domain-containing protein n=1 Tax=Rhodoferax sp. TaxID=50421 RepID=UPI002716EAE7|nr:PilZ domain-containing protein [Rhodoferax sp.]MDO9199720.1 PilZ domain-containing protein [Rhodoferax sp.]
MNDIINPSGVSTLPLRALRLRPGMALQTKRIVEGASKKESQFLAAIEGKGVMVGPVGPDGAKTGLEEGEICIVRGFTGQHEFSFLTKVLQTFEKPFPYALLQYPKHADARLVRQSMRIKTSMPAVLSMRNGSGPDEAPAQDVTLIDISTAGAMIRSVSSLAAVGMAVTLSFAVDFEGAPVELVLSGTVCHNNATSGQDGYFTGLAFNALTQHDKLVLHYMTESRPG